MKSFKIIFSLALFLIVATWTCIHFWGQAEYGVPSDWAIGRFVELETTDSVTVPDRSGVFYCPATESNIFWENGEILNSSAIVRHDSIFLFFSVTEYGGADAEQSISRIGYSVSVDGVHFKRGPKPVLYPDRDGQIEYEWIGGCEAPRVSETKDGGYVMFYTQCNRSCKRLAVATSRDLKTWTKHGPAFRKAYNGKYYNSDSRLACPVTRIEGGRQLVEKINGKYYLYWGTGNLYMAVSDNMIDWTPVEDENGDLKKVLSPRDDKFDSDLIASGHSAVMTNKGIVLFYNARNKEGMSGDRGYPSRMLGGGQALFSSKKPVKLLARLDQPFVYSKNILAKEDGNRSAATFLQGLAYFKKDWYLYYGSAGAKMQIAVCDFTDADF